MSTPVPTPLYPANDFAWIANLKDVNPTTGRTEKLATGTVTAFLATTNLPTATTADPTLSVTCTQIVAGKWLVFFDAAILTASLLSGLFGAAPTACHLIVVQANGTRTVADLIYTPTRQATIA